MSEPERLGISALVTLRWILPLAWIPFVTIVGLFVAGWVAGVLGIEDVYVAAVVLPFLGLGSAWAIAPKPRMLAVLLYLGIGLLLALVFACPVSFPEGHPRAYEDNYVPFVITVGSGILFTIILGAIEEIRARR